MPSLRSDFNYDFSFLSGGDGELLGSVSATEETPLLETIENEPEVGTTVSGITTIVLLFVVLLVGISIGAYLLVLQHDADNVLPPVKEMLDARTSRLVNGSEWDRPGLTVIPSQPFQAETVIIQQTGTDECLSLETCVPILRDLKVKTGTNDSLPYNFLVSSDGTAYEGLGWTKLSPLQPELKPLVLAFIGNFTNVAPSTDQIIMAKSLIYDFLKKDLLVKNYTITGNLYDNFKESTKWKDIGSDVLYTS